MMLEKIWRVTLLTHNDLFWILNRTWYLNFTFWFYLYSKPVQQKKTDLYISCFTSKQYSVDM